MIRKLKEEELVTLRDECARYLPEITRCFYRNILGTVLVYECDGKIAGILAAECLVPMCFMRKGDEKHRLVIKFLYVQPDYRHRGIASELLDSILQFAKEHSCDEVITTVDADTYISEFFENRFYKPLRTTYILGGF